MTRNPYENDIVISWPELHRDSRFLSHELHSKGPWKGIIAVTAITQRMKVSVSGEIVPTTALPMTQLSDQKSAVTVSSR